ncbi:hypothetical protein C5167_015635 [Papaver somniferum]|uniref:7-dehydrocholesterol reductase n=1 Tax=Papaver somniferum TaxID=3469 RepID=A0A4Y7JAM5_PAPSO|nr:hypothetical protein C5167_015635 [Papaver somniferum]
MVHADGSVVQTFDYLKQNGLQGFVDIWPRPTAIAWKIIACYAAFEDLLQLALPGKRFEGPISPAGNVPVHKGHIAPSSTDSGSSGNPIIDFYWAMELYPRIGKYFDIKVFTSTNCRFGMMSWGVLAVTYCIKQYEMNGKVAESMLVNIVLMLVYVTKFFWWEAGYWSKMDITHDRAAFYICWGCLVWVPSVYTSPGMYLINHPVNLGTQTALLILASGVLCVYINYDCNRQIQVFRRTNRKCLVWGRAPSKVGFSTSLSLRARDIISAFFWTVPALFTHAKVHGYNNVEGENRLLELRLKPSDYFGYGDLSSYHQADVIALDELSCLVLPHEHTTLLQPKSIWTVDETHETSLMERILHLDPVDVNLFRGITLPDTPRTGKELTAASKTVDRGKLVRSFHNYFLLAGDLGRFATRRVDAMQRGNVIFTLLASFQKEEIGFEHQQVTMPSAPAPETLLSMEELRERSYLDLRLPDLSFWLKAQGTLSDDPALHRCVAAYISDLLLIVVSLKPHVKGGLKTMQIESPSASSGRGFCSARMFNQKGQLVASFIQEGVIRTAKAQQSVAKSNL